MRKVINTTNHATVTYSQNKEDIVLASFFPNVTDGFYVDVGAAHPDHLSVTKFFYMKGWHGINVEPNERLFQLIGRARPRDTSYRVAVSNTTKKEATFREYLGDGLSTLSGSMQKGYEGATSPVLRYYRDYKVPVKQLSEILVKTKPKEIHFMKIDVEGYEYEVLDSNDWDVFRPHIICIEANHIEKDWHELVKKQQYELIFHDGLNDYYADMRYYSEPPKVDYNMLYDPQVLSAAWMEKIEAIQKEIQDAKNETTMLRTELALRPLPGGEGLRYRNLAKVFLKKTDALITGKLSASPVKPRSVAKVADHDDDTYDKDVWDVTTNNWLDAKKTLAVRGYARTKHGLKKIAKMMRNGR